METKHSVLIVGKGLAAEAAAQQVTAAGAGVVQTACAPVRVSGGPGRFDVILDEKPQSAGKRVDAVIIADSAETVPGCGPYALVPGPGVVPLGQAAGWAGRTRQEVSQAAGIRNAVILNGLGRPSCPAVLRQVLDLAIALQRDWGVQTYLLTGHLNVAGHGLEALQHQAKASGVLVFKFNEKMPRIDQDTSGVAIAFEDAVSGQSLALKPELVVFDEDWAPSGLTQRTAAVLQVDRGIDGFAQADNVHRLAVATNRVGVFAAGGSRAVLDPCQQSLEGCLAALAGMQTFKAQTAASTALIDRGHCVRCLTCYRLCPHRAIVLEPRPLILAQACAGCGICMAQCPAQAISVGGIGPGDMAQQLLAALPSGGALPVVVLGCRRSAEAAWQLALEQGWQPPSGVCFVGMPCAGSLSLSLLIAAFNAGAGGVLVLSCHEGNCYSQSGSRNGRDQAHNLAAILPAIGLEPHRLDHFTLAANMERRLIQGVEAFAETIGRLGPPRVGTSASKGNPK